MGRNIKKLGWRQKCYVGFLTKYPGWHSYTRWDREERDTVERLAKRGIVEIHPSHLALIRLAEV